MANLKSIDISGAAIIKNKGKLTVKKLMINGSGASDIDLNITTNDLKIELSGASKTSLNGYAENFNIELSGAGELNAENLTSTITTILISGAGHAVIFAKEELKATVSGCLLYTSPSPRDKRQSRMPSSA